MKIIIVGCGKIGTTIVDSLVKENHDVVVIDNNPTAIADIKDVYDIMCICGNGADYDVLLEAGIDSAEMFIAVTGSDELNMLSCIIAKKMGASHTVARVRNPEYNDKNLTFLKHQIDLSLAINPEMLVASEIFNILKLPSAANIETFSRRNFEMIELRLKADSQIVGMSLIELRKKYQAKFLICVVQREQDVYIPDGNFVLKSGDRIGLIASPSEGHKLLKMMGIMQKQAKNVIILGASKTAYYLSKMLLSGGSSVKIIDSNFQRCEEISAELDGAVVINGDGVQQDLLLEEGIRSADAFVALTGMDEQNILISFFAMSQNGPKVITKANNGELASMADRLGLECIVSPKKTISDLISRYARALENSLGSNVETLYKLMDGKAEAVEFNVQSDFEFLGVPIKDMKFKSNILVAGIIRGRKAMIPSGDDVIEIGDKVIVIAAGRILNDLADIIA